jgi:hypothetical protein
MAEVTKKVVLDTPFKDAIAKKSGGLGSPSPQSQGTQGGSKK